MKPKLLFSTIFVFLFIGATFAQTPTIHNPDAVVTVAHKQISAWGQVNQTKSGTIVLDFEGLGNADPINDFYNGGTSGDGFSGTNYGIEFSVNALGLIASTAGGSGNFSNNPSGQTVMFFTAGIPYMNFVAGFDTGFSFYYASDSQITIEVWDGLNGTGSKLASQAFPGTPSPYTVWEAASVAFDGVAQSVTFVGAANACAFDDVTFGNLTPGGSDEVYPVPVSWWSLLLSLLLIVGLTVIRIKRVLS